MKIEMVPGACVTPYQGTGSSFCESCFARFLRRDCEPNLACITTVEEDGAHAPTLVLRAGSYQETWAMTEARRDAWADGAWTGWVDFVARAEAAATSSGWADLPAGWEWEHDHAGGV